jgi:hypothetical protein
MARTFVRTSSQRIDVSTLTNISAQMTFGCWFNPASTPGAGTQQTFLGKTAENVTASRNYTFDYRNGGPTAAVSLEFACTPTLGNFGEWAWANTFTNGTWHHQMWTVDFSTNPITVVLYVDGAVKTLTTAGTLTGTTGLTQGVQKAAIGDVPQTAAAYDGRIAEVFVTRDILTANHARALAGGARTSGVLAGHPIDLYTQLGVSPSGSEVDLSGNARIFVFNGSPALANHAPINLSSRLPPSFLDAGAAPPPPTGEPLHPTPFGSFHNFGRLGS